MTEKTLTIVDTTRIQTYIYRSNRLAENIGASHLVYLATQTWVDDFLKKYQGETLSSAGGNHVILFDTLANAKAFTRKLSQRVIESAPGLQIRVHHTDYDDEKQFLGDVIREALQALETADKGYLRSTPQLGLSVTVMGRSTALPVTGYAQETNNVLYPASAEILAKTDKDNRDDAESELHQKTQLLGDYVFPRDFDDLGRTKGEESTIAVIHADGNGIGQLVINLAGQFRKQFERKERPIADINHDYIQRLQGFSKTLTQVTEQAIQSTVAFLIDWSKTDTKDQTSPQAERFVEQLRNHTRDRDMILPMRPLIIGGDDVTIVCDGRIGVALATHYLTSFERYAEEANFRQFFPDADSVSVTASAGVAIVKTHYPFSRAYELADDLCGNAKKRYRENGGGSYIDWHFGTSGMINPDIDVIRREQYRVDGGKSLTQRPFRVDFGKAPEWKSLQTTLSSLLKWARSKRKALHQTLPKGKEATERWLKIYMPKVNIDTVFDTEGNCLYYDALEMIDSHIDMEPAIAKAEQREESNAIRD